MKTNINKSAKRVLSITLSFVMLIGTLFTANVGVNITADAETAKTKIVYWDGDKQEPTDADNDGVYIINTAEELAWIAQYNAESDEGRTYRIADDIKAIVLQPSSLSGVMNLTTAKQTKDFFENNTASAIKWITKEGAGFFGTLDGNNATIYGMYCAPDADHAGLIAAADSGAKAQNLAIKNSYLNNQSTDKSGFIFSYTLGNSYGKKEKGTVTIENCLIENCYMSTANAVDGFAIGNIADDLLIEDSAFYNNVATVTGYTSYSGRAPLMGTHSDSSTLTMQNCIVQYELVPRQAYNASTYTNVYTEDDTWSCSTGSTIKYSDSEIIGIAAKTFLPADFIWGTEWFELEGALPTPVKPVDYTPLIPPVIWDGTAAESYAAYEDGTFGDGTEENPHLIETAEQLYKAVTERSTFDDNTPKYYKVKDGVTKLNLSDSTNLNNWTATQLDNPFKGNFDGNGVVIKDLYSTGAQVGLFQYLGIGAVVKNITFDGAVINSTGASAAVLANTLTQRTATVEGTLYTGVSNQTYGSVLIHNVAVINASITATGYVSDSAQYNVAGGLVAYTDISDGVQFNNCLFDGVTSSLTGSYKAGIYSTMPWNTIWDVRNSVSIGVHITPNRDSGSGVYNDYSNYSGNYSTSPTFVRNSYSIDTNGTSLDIGDCKTDSAVSFDSVKSNFHTGLPMLDWASGWTVATVGGREIPMPTVRTAADKLDEDDNGHAVLDWGTYLGTYGDAGASFAGGSYIDGTYGHFNQYHGSGTYETPYIIYDALDLARAIGCGGVNYGEKLYFMLANDIDLSGFQWLSGIGYKRILDNTVYFVYSGFEGTLNGNGHTITGLYAVASYKETTPDTANQGLAGLIPMLNGGTVKLLNMRHCHTAAETSGTGDTKIGNAGVMFGGSKSASVVEQSSVEDCCAIGVTELKGADVITLKNSYYIDSQTGDSQYFDADGNLISDLSTIDYDAGVWYKGGLDSDTPKLLTRAKAMPKTDVDGDGEGYDYGGNDLTALRSMLMRKPAYANVYGDVNNNGETNILDLIVLKREMVDDYNHKEDRFWRAAEIGNVDIFYGENDNYDAAREMQLYFEMRFNVQVDKHIVLANDDTTVTHPGDNTGNTPATNDSNHFDIIVGDIPAAGYVSEWSSNDTDDYKVWSDHDSATLWLQGESTTSVYEAVTQWCTDSYGRSMTSVIKEGDVIAETAIPEYKNYVEVDGEKYYYTWGDEFGKLSDGTAVAQNPDSLNRGNWINTVGHSGGATDAENLASDMKDLRSGATPVIEALTEVKDGKLIIKRGYKASAFDEDTESTNGMIALTDEQAISATNTGDNDRYYSAGSYATDNLMLFKEGYIEFRASIPAEGHAFPALWLHSMGNANIKSNASWSESLYGKIFKLNNSANGVAYPWNGQDEIVFPTNASDLATFKYQVPSISYEIDIFELMQDPLNVNYDPDNEAYAGTGDSQLDPARNKLNAVAYYNDKPTMHRWYRNGINDAGTFYIRDFVNGTISGAITSSDTSTPIATGSIDFGTERKSMNDGFDTISAYTCDASTATNQAAYKAITAMRRYGFVWNADKDGNFTFKVIVYDVNGDGDESDTQSVALTQHAKEGTSITTDDAKRMAEMYMYILIDNEYYTHNNYNGASGAYYKSDVTDYEYNDLLTAGGTDATHMEIDYVRVYQEDGKRDIVTAETEAFNNGNHFGY